MVLHRVRCVIPVLMGIVGLMGRIGRMALGCDVLVRSALVAVFVCSDMGVVLAANVEGLDAELHHRTERNCSEDEHARSAPLLGGSQLGPS